MRGVLTTAVLVSIVGVLLGMGLGGFITYRGLQGLIESVPGSPVVVGAEYDRAANELVLTVFNPGGLPLTVLNGDLVFKPAEGEGYSVANVPINTVIPGQSVATLRIRLKEQTVKPGDVIKGGFTYRYPYIGQLYYTSYPLTVGRPLRLNPAEVLQRAKEEAQKGGENR
ncbi:MAG: hypothetical protein GXO08_00265 [Aquificae bacterium]|nr:hypothetical protein [Aquificota bacterium]